jgi:hypothetical protein
LNPSKSSQTHDGTHSFIHERKRNQAMLEAEFAALDYRLADAMSKYCEGEELAGKAGFLDVQGLACERSG